MADNFYVTLPSNVQSYDYFPENTVANYITKLASRIELTENWEVGLVEMSYTLSWYNLPKDEPIMLYYFDQKKAVKLDRNIKVPKGRYDTIDELVLQINEQLKLFERKIENINVPPEITYSTTDARPKLTFASRNRSVTINFGVKNNKHVFVVFSPNICQMIGFEYSKLIAHYDAEIQKYQQIETDKNSTVPRTAPVLGPNKIKAPQPFDLSGGYHSLFVYSNIVSPSFVGDSFTQLLRLVQIPTNAKFGEQILITYPNTYYVPLLTRDFETIEIDIKDDTGQNVPFEFGRSIVVLHFRKVIKRPELA